MRRLTFALILVFALAPLAQAAKTTNEATTRTTIRASTQPTTRTTQTKEKKKMNESTTETLKARDAMHPLLKMETSLGDIVLELDAEKAPISTLNFIEYAQTGFYKGTIFHRVISNFMIQGGGMYPDNREKSDGKRPSIKNEWRNGLKNVNGSIAMARIGYQPDSATAQFFINVKDNDFLDQPNDGAGYAVFGKVVQGMDTVEKIRTAPTESDGREKARPTTPIVIKDVKLVSEFDKAAAEKLAGNK